MPAMPSFEYIVYVFKLSDVQCNAVIEPKLWSYNQNENEF